MNDTVLIDELIERTNKEVDELKTRIAKLHEANSSPKQISKLYKKIARTHDHAMRIIKQAEPVSGQKLAKKKGKQASRN